MSYVESSGTPIPYKGMTFQPPKKREFATLITKWVAPDIYAKEQRMKNQGYPIDEINNAVWTYEQASMSYHANVGAIARGRFDRALDVVEMAFKKANPEGNVTQLDVLTSDDLIDLALTLLDENPKEKTEVPLDISPELGTKSGEKEPTTTA